METALISALTSVSTAAGSTIGASHDTGKALTESFDNDVHRI
jgi:hypothetical protein